MVIRTEGPVTWVDVDGETVRCTLRGRLKRGGPDAQDRTTRAVVIGDVVAVTRQAADAGVIASVAPRRSELSRPGFHGLVHVMAANLDQLVIVVAARQPAFSPHLVERFLVAARHGRMKAVLVVNKCDLAEASEIQAAIPTSWWSEMPVVLTSAATGQGLEPLRALLQPRVSVFAGVSGVGKTSLVNLLFPRLPAGTGRMARPTAARPDPKGRHTTSSSCLYPLPGGGYLGDLPGIRQLELFEHREDAVAEVFPEIEAAARRCRFRDCTHGPEPGCGVRAAMDHGEIAPERFQSYLRLRRT